MTEKTLGGIDRRALFKGVAVGGVSTAFSSAAPEASAAAAAAAPPAVIAAPPSAAALAAEQDVPPHEPGLLGRTGGDYMVDAIKQLDIPYVTALPGASFRGLHESLINYGGNKAPELITCLHEEVSVAMAHGYAKVTGKPLLAMLHAAVGVQHGAMAIYNAWCDRAPVVLISGNTIDGTTRRGGVEWDHSILDQGATIRDFVKWDAQPISLSDFNESLKRAYQLAATPPFGPTLITVDSELQERSILEGLKPAALRVRSTAAVGDSAALTEAAKMLVAAASPIIVADRLVRTPQGMADLVRLAELLQAPVIDRYARLNMPTQHYLAQTQLGGPLVRGADVILGLELNDPYGTINTVADIEGRASTRDAGKNARFIHISSRDLLIHGNYQDFERYQPADLAITGDGEATLPYLLDAVRWAVDPAAQIRIDARKAKLQSAFKDLDQRTRVAAAYGWDASPITTARTAAELYMQIQNLDWGLVGGSNFFSNWPLRLWDFTLPLQFTGSAGGAGVGYLSPAAVGAALAFRDSGRIPVAIVGDGDFMCTPAAIWTAAHHKLPLFMVIHNNRAYHQEVMHIQRMADRHGRGITNAHIGTGIDSPNIDYAKLAQSLGVQGIGPISDPKELAPAFKRAVEIVRAGEPVLVDVVSQPR